VRDSSVVRRDTGLTRDSAAARARNDSAALRARKDSAAAADTIKAALAQSELPVLADPSGSYHWTRRTMFESGALTVQDLLDRTPGLTGMRANWIAQPMMSAYLGDPRRLRISVDGFELEELDPRMGRVWDLSQIPLWSLDDLVIERSASEVRLLLRTWRVERTTPFTRTDIYTGDQATNLYRGLFGRRYRHGEVLQLAGQQYSTTAGRFAESSDQLGLMTRVGIGRPTWTADAVLMRRNRHRGRNFSQTLGDTVPATESVRSDAYLRLAWFDTSRGAWAQTLAGTSIYTHHAPDASSSSTTADTGRSRSQYVLTGGYNRGALRASFTQRFLFGFGRHVATPSARIGWDAPRLSLSAFGEGRGLDSTRRFDVSAVVRPIRVAYFAGSIGTERPLSDSAGAPVFSRIEAGLRARDLWLSGGVMHRDAVEVDPVAIVRSATPLRSDSAATGAFATIRGRVWQAVYLDAHAVRWSDTTGAYRPQYQTRTELYLSTSLLDRFPTGNFHIRASVVHEYRSTLLWPDTSGFTRVTGYRVFSTLLQFKIVSAEVFWNYRNTFDARYAEIPAYRRPRLTSIYGVRWEFWN